MLTRSLLSMLYVLALFVPTYAQSSTFSDAVVFSRQKLTIDAMRLIELPQTNMPFREGEEDTGADTVEPQIEYEEQAVAYAFDVMVRPMALVQPGSLQRLGWLKHDEGMMLTMESNDLVALGSLGINTSVDAILIRPNGIIDAIAPDITPEQMEGAIETRKPVVATLLIKAGMAEHLKLKPGNQVNHRYFQPDTRVLR